MEILFDYTSLMNWSEVVPSAVGAFFQKYNIYPNILTANTIVFEKLLQLCIAEGIIENIDTADQASLELGGYISHEWALHYIKDDSIPECHFLLVYDPSIICKEYE